jgi:lipopolysaccharide export system permease protein
MTILDRYVLKKFLVPFLYCIFGFIAIWLVFDLSDNGPDFIKAKTSLSVVFEFYLSQAPEIVVISLPVGMLLALLYSLTQMSRSNEVISMLGAGRSVVRVLFPLFVVGLILVGVTAFFNYEGAPHAAKIKKEMLKEINSGGTKKRERAITAHLFRNREDYRTWYMRKCKPDSQELDDVHIIQDDKDGIIRCHWMAIDARFDSDTSIWHLENARYIELDAAGKVIKDEPHKHLAISNWSETPWRIASSVMNSDYLSVPELHDYLSHNNDFPVKRLAPFRTNLEYRWALPWVCILVVFIAAPLGIVYSRRGILGGVASAITLFFLLVFISSLTVALGKGGILAPAVAAWGPLVLFLIIGFFLLWMRSNNRELALPKFL